MGWKSTKNITRADAVNLILQHLMSASDSKIEEVLTNIGFGDDSNLPHYGYNFNITNKPEEHEENI